MLVGIALNYIHKPGFHAICVDFALPYCNNISHFCFGLFHIYNVLEGGSVEFNVPTYGSFYKSPDQTAE